MKGRLLGQIPGLAEAVMRQEHRTVAVLLRSYVYRTVVWSNDGLLIQQYCQGDLRKLAPSDTARLFEAREIGVLCCGTAVFLARLYGLFGYAATWFDYGIPGVSTHVTTVVTLPTERGPEPVLQDATFNCTFSLSDVPQPSFFEVIDRVFAGRAQEIVMEKGVVRPRTICFSDTPEGRSNLGVYRSSRILEDEPQRIASGVSGTPILCARGDLDYHTSYLRRNGQKIRERLSQALRQPQEQCCAFQLMLFPLQLPVFEDAGLQAKAEELTGRANEFSEPERHHEPSAARTADQRVPV